MHLLISVLVLLQAGAPTKPAAPLDAKNPASVLEHAVYASRTQPGYETTFTSSLSVPKSDPIKYQGSAAWTSPSLLNVQYTASGGDHKRIIRAGESAWVWHSLVEDWVGADEAGMPGAGKGIQNPDEILAVLGARAADARAGDGGKISLALSGAALQEIMTSQAKGGIDWKKSSATVLVQVDEAGRIRELGVSAALVDPNVKGEVKYEATVTVGGYGRPAPMPFVDDKKKPILLSKEVQAAVDKVLQEKR